MLAQNSIDSYTGPNGHSLSLEYGEFDQFAGTRPRIWDEMRRLEERVLEIAKLVRSREDVLALLAHLETKDDDGAWAIQRLKEEIAAYADEVDKALDLQGVDNLLNELEIDENAPLLVTALSEIGPERGYG
ncbi:MAG: hypothetical protein RKE50_11435 [Pseudohaliea sp.]